VRLAQQGCSGWLAMASLQHQRKCEALRLKREHEMQEGEDIWRVNQSKSLSFIVSMLNPAA